MSGAAERRGQMRTDQMEVNGDFGMRVSEDWWTQKPHWNRERAGDAAVETAGRSAALWEGARRSAVVATEGGGSREDAFMRADTWAKTWEGGRSGCCR